MRIKIVANKCPWSSWPQKITELANWFAPKFQIDFAIEHTNFEEIPFVDYDDGNPNTKNMRGIDPKWYDDNVVGMGIGYDMVLFVMNKKQWKGFGSRGWRSDSDQGPIQLQLGCDENQKEKWPNFPSMDSFFQIARHEICHGLFMISGQIDTTHFYWDMGKLELARDEVRPPKYYSMPIIIRALNYLLKMVTKLPENTPEDTPGELLHQTAINCIGTDASPENKAPQELSCAESVNHVYKKAFGNPIGGDVSTYRLFEALKTHPYFKKVELPLPGDVVISPTGFGGKNGITNGHTGIVGEGGTIMSNESKSGKWERNYTLESWRARYATRGGYPVVFFRRV